MPPTSETAPRSPRFALVRLVAASLALILVLSVTAASPAGASDPGESAAAIEAKAVEFDRAWKDQVTRLYGAAFLRLPDDGGAAYWDDVYRNGFPHHAIATEFAVSPEFRQRYGTLDHEGFVRQLYRNVMGREGDAAGVAHWRGQLGAGRTRGWVLVGFSDSAEFVTKTGTTSPPALAPNPVPAGTNPVPFAHGAFDMSVESYSGQRHWFSSYPAGDFDRIAGHIDFYLASVTGWPAPGVAGFEDGSRSWNYEGGPKGQLHIGLRMPTSHYPHVALQVTRIT